MAESNADKTAESTASSPVAPDETIKDLDVRLSEEQLNDVKGGEGPTETITFPYGTVHWVYS